MFSSAREKRYLGVKVDVFVFNTIVLIGSTLALLGLLHLDSAAPAGSAARTEQLVGKGIAFRNGA